MSSTTLGTNESLVFENHSTQPMVVTFTEPADLKERIRDVRQGPDGWLYLLTDSPSGRILRIER